MDRGLNRYFSRSFIQAEKINKELSLLKQVIKYQHFCLEEELSQVKQQSIRIDEETICHSCAKKIQQYPFYWIPKSN